MASTRKKKTR